jgi:hypothetical protein
MSVRSLDWEWLRSGLRFGLIDGNIHPVGCEDFTPIPHFAGYEPGRAPSNYGSDSFRCNNAWVDTDPTHARGYRWTGIQERLFGAGSSQGEWTIALTLNSYRILSQNLHVFNVYKPGAPPTTYIRFSLNPQSNNRWLYFYIGASVFWTKVYTGVFGTEMGPNQFPVVLTMNTSTPSRKIYVNGALGNSSAVACNPWTGTSILTLGCAWWASPKNCNDGNYGTFLISDFEWNAEQVLAWSNNPNGWARPEKRLFFFPSPLVVAPCLHANVKLQSPIGANVKGSDRLSSNLKLQTPVGVNIRGRNKIGVNTKLGPVVGSNVGLCKKGAD